MASLMGNNAKTRLYKCSSFILVLTFLLADIFVVLEGGFWLAPETHAMTSAIKVESFEQDVGADGSVFSLSNDVGATSSAFIRMNTGTRKTSAGPIGNTGNVAPNVGTVGLVLSSTNQVTVERISSTPVKVIGEVWRYQGIAGGGNEFITRDRVEVPLTGTSAIVPVSGVVNSDRVVPFVTGYTLNGTSVNDWNDATIAAHMNDSGDLEVSRNNSGLAAAVYVDIVEFTGTNWTVCHGFSNGHDTAEQTINLNTSGDGQGGAACDVGDWSTATIIQATMEGDTAETGLSDTLALVRPGVDTETVVFDVQQDVNARNDGRAWVQVLQNDDLSVDRDSDASVVEGDNSFGFIAFPAGVDDTTSLDELALEWFADTSGVGTAHMRGGLHAGILDDSIVYADGATVPDADYDSTLPGNFEAELTFAAVPSGVIYEAGGTGTGSFVGYNSSGDFIIRAGSGVSVSPTDAARIVITDTEYDFSSRTGTLTWQFAPDTNSVQLSFDESSDGSIDYSTSTTAIAAWADWSGGDDGGVGTSNGNVAGSELASGFDFNGTIVGVQFSQSESGILHWIHRSGNNVGIEYGVIDLSNLEAITSPTFATVAGNQIVTTTVGVTDVFFGQKFAVIELLAAQNITNIVVSESGTADAAAGLSNVRLRYELDTSAPHDCVDESYDGTETQYGSASSFSGADGSVVFSDSVSISPTAAFCGYVVADVTSAAQDGETFNFSIADTETDIAVTGSGITVSGGTLGDGSVTTVVDAEITQANYHWRNDDGSETGATSATGGLENTAGLAFDTLTAQRLRIGIAGEGTGTESNSYRLEYAEKVTTCSAISSWIDVGAGGGAWDMFDSLNVAEAGNTTNISIANGGVSDGTGTFVTPNGGIRDVTSQTGSLSITAYDYTELEYSVRATGSAIEGVGYCFRVTDAGTPLRAYNNYPEATLSADITVGVTGTQTATVVAGDTSVYVGGQYSVVSNSGTFTLTDVTVTEVGSIDAGQYLSNVQIAYEPDTTNPRNCESVSYDGTEPTVSGSAFADPNGSSSVTLSESVQNNRAVCLYVVVDVSADAPNGDTIDFEISLPNGDVVVPGATVGPGSALAIDGSTVVQAGALTQSGYHWRNDDGDESGATSATGGSENTAITNVFQGSERRLRLAVSNDGAATAVDTGLRLEYGTKVTTCADVGSWQRVDSGVAFDMATTSQLIDGDDTADIALGIGGVTNPNTTLLTPNSAQLELTDQLATTSITTSEYIKIEYALQITESSGFGATYCFRLSNDGSPLATYTNYPELTVQERQDFFIQRGVATTSGTGVTLTAGVDYTAPSSNSAAFVRITDTSMTGAGSDTLGQTRTPDNVFAYIENGDNLTTSFSIVRPPTATDNTRVTWELIEYIGVTGADNEFVVRDAGEVTYGASALFATGTAATGVVDDADVVVFITGQYNPATNVNNYNTGLSISSWDAAGDQPVFERGDADGEAARVSYAVVEFTGASWQVQRAEHTFTAAGVAETELINPVNSLLRSFVHAQKISGDELFNLDESGHEVWLSSIGAVSFQLENGSTNPGQQRSVAWVIENTQIDDGSMRVYRSNGLIAQGGVQPITFVYPIGATVNTFNATMWATTRSTGGGSAHPRAQLGARILDETQFELWKSDEGQNQNFRVEIVEWPVAETSIRQTHYRFYVDNDTLTPTDPWPAGASDLGENTAMTDIDEPLGEGERTRIRMGLFINNASLVADSVSFKLQYARRVTTCSAIGTWDDVGDVGSGAIWRAFDASPVDGAELLGGGALLLSISNVAGTYEENGPSQANPNTVQIGDYIEYDWIVENNAAIQKSSYCFRMAENDGAELDGYNVYPTVRTSGYTPVIANWRWYTDEENLTPTIAAAAETSAPSAISTNEDLKLRVSVTEVEGAPGQNIKFNLQYSQYPDFRDAQTVNSSTSCSGNSLWCYADGAGINNEIIDTTVLTGVDSCISGVGDGCGTVNEAEGLSGIYNQPAFSTSEHEFTIRHDGARVNGVYYFRLFDATNGVPLFASSSFPSLTTEGALLTFTVNGLDSQTVVEGVTTDATTTATQVNFGSVPLDTDIEAAQRLTIFTNGTEGYRVYMQIDQNLTDSYGNTIPGVSGTNAAPAAWASQCTGATTGCFGYHVGDNSLYDGSLRFALDDTFAGVESGPVEVMSSNVPVTFDVSEIVYRTRVGFFQPAGDYTATVQYIVVPQF